MNQAEPVLQGAGPAAHPYPTVVENRKAHAIEGPLRVVAFNAAGGAYLDGITACFTQEPLRGAAVILLSEADQNLLRSGRRRIAFELAARLNMSCAYVPEFRLSGPGSIAERFIGNAILSKLPLEEVVPIPLLQLLPPRPKRQGLTRYRLVGRQSALVAKIDLRGKSIWVCVAHLDSRIDPGGRAMQMRGLLESFPAGPAILGGDLNTTTVDLRVPGAGARVVREMLLNSRRFRDPIPHEPLFEELVRKGFEVRGANAEGMSSFTFSRIIPPWMRPRLDWIALRALRPVPGTAAVVQARPNFFAPRVSDHDFVSVAVDL